MGRSARSLRLAALDRLTFGDGLVGVEDDFLGFVEAFEDLGGESGTLADLHFPGFREAVLDGEDLPGSVDAEEGVGGDLEDLGFFPKDE